MSRVAPDENEHGEPCDCESAFEVIEEFGGLESLAAALHPTDMDREVAYGQTEIANIVRDKHSDTHISEMKTIRQPDQRNSNDMMPDQLLEILPRLLKLQRQHNELLCPVRRLQQIVCLERTLMLPVGESFEHAVRIEVPDRRAVHHVETVGTEDGKVQCRVRLLHEAALFCAGLYAALESKGADDALHEELAREAQNDGIESHKRKVIAALAVFGGRGAGYRIREEYSSRERVLLVWSDEICGEED